MINMHKYSTHPPIDYDTFYFQEHWGAQVKRFKALFYVFYIFYISMFTIKKKIFLRNLNDPLLCDNLKVEMLSTKPRNADWD